MHLRFESGLSAELTFAWMRELTLWSAIWN